MLDLVNPSGHDPRRPPLTASVIEALEEAIEVLEDQEKYLSETDYPGALGQKLKSKHAKIVRSIDYLRRLTEAEVSKRSVP